MCGPFSTASISGAKYYVVFTEDSTRFPYVFTIEKKSEVVNVWREFRLKIQAGGTNVCVLRSDNGGEFKGLEKDLKDNGITWEPSPPYTQHANGVSERMIRTLNTKVRALLLDARCPDMFWGEALHSACEIQRRLPQPKLGGLSASERI